MKLHYDELLSIFAFKFYLRRYNVEEMDAFFYEIDDDGTAVQINSIKTRVESAYGFSA